METAPDPSFIFDGECRNIDNPDIFFEPSPRLNPEDKAKREAEAKATCGRCGVREECLDWVLAIGEQDGIWAGLTKAERRRL